MPHHAFTLRALEPSDSAAVSNLIAEFDGDVTTHFVIDPYTAITSGTEDQTLAVVAECRGFDGLVGMGTVRLGSMSYNGNVLPFAGLDGLKVRTAFRGQGLGRQLAEWRIQQARQAYGDDCVMVTGLLRSNHASRAVATKWCREFIEPVRVVVMSTRARPPRPVQNITVREVEPHEYAEYAAKQNSFYRNYNLYKPTDAAAIARCLRITPSDQQVYRLFVAVDRGANLLAGVRLWFRGLLKMDAINHPPLPLRVLNHMLHFLPADYKIRDIGVEAFWHAPGQERVAHYLWEAIRWHGRANGTTLGISLDPRDPLLTVLGVKPWHLPRFEVALAVHGPMPIERHRLVYGIGRV